MKRLLYIVFPLLLLTACTRDMDGVYDNTPVGNFECLWRTIDEKYCFVDEKDIDWLAVHDRYLPQVQQLASDDYKGLFDLFDRMLDTLCDGHVNLYSDFDVSRCEKWYEGYPENFDQDILTTYYLTDYRTAGGLQYCLIDSGKIGYIYYGSFSSGFSMNNMYYVLTEFQDCLGIILDVRHNGGGSLENAYRLASTFIPGDTLVGYWQHKNGPGHDDFSELEEMWVRKDDMLSKWLRPVIVLSNRHSYSATNFFINCMRHAPNCLIVGGRSGGGGGMPLSYELPNGWMIRFSSVRMTNTSKNSIEKGITPHVKINLHSTDKDDIIESAIEIIEKAYDTSD